MTGVQTCALPIYLLEPSERWAGKQPVREALLDTRPNTPLPWLYDLSTDIGETKNISEANPEVVKELTEIANSLDQQLERELRPPYEEKQALK